MKFSLILTSLAAVASAAPGNIVQKRARVFTDKTFDELSISGGKAGTAKADAEAKLAGLPKDPAQLALVDKLDLSFLSHVNQICNQAEISGYTKTIAGLAPGEDVLALERGKIQNKVLKLTATVLALQAQQTKGDNVTARLEEETKKLEKNIALDVAEAGKTATGLKFDANTASADATKVEKDEVLIAKADEVINKSQELAGAGAKGKAEGKNKGDSSSE
ncbi:small secreted protein [Colletotrichum higginsianum]|nr:small secreted protein [Colletotrichum higginsianum]